jgi:DNA invertase Pin-like site-specific DNA recombinase
MSDARGSAGMIQRGVSDLFAAYEREVIRERTTAALAVKKAKGERVGAVPYGFQVAADGVRLEPCEAEQATITSVRGMRESGLSLRAIVAQLAASGTVSRVGKPLALTQVANMLRAAAA